MYANQEGRFAVHVVLELSFSVTARATVFTGSSHEGQVHENVPFSTLALTSSNTAGGCSRFATPYMGSL